ncbi:MAG: hypothetical protein RL186_1538, partial [Pseudomonadota bacterium]
MQRCCALNRLANGQGDINLWNNARRRATQDRHRLDTTTTDSLEQSDRGGRSMPEIEFKSIEDIQVPA